MTERSTLVVETIKREYWQCLEKDHRHLSQEVADRCIEKNSRKPKKSTRAEKDESLRKLARLFADGESYTLLAQLRGVSNSRIYSRLEEFVAYRGDGDRYSIYKMSTEQWYAMKMRGRVQLALLIEFANRHDLSEIAKL